ncbi:MAG TPA: L,D-transpeptidase [Xanthobacteraceae bacterium]|nr:L,D-transpeptidase [Xanthobacteraceae bacterium]
MFFGHVVRPVLLGFAGALLLTFWCAPLTAAPDQLTAESINNAELAGTNRRSLSPAVIARAQILLDRANFSPGEIDAKDGENFKKALHAFAEASGLPAKRGLTKEIWTKLMEAGSEPAVTGYQITEDDVRGPFLPDLPAEMEDMKDLPSVPYTSAAEALAEKFHMSEALLRKLNAGRSLDRAGEMIIVANVLAGDAPSKASRVEIAKAAQTVRVFDAQNNLIAFYPATVGSEEKPSPSGTLKVTNVQPNPVYRYNPKYRFKGVRATKPFTIRPGPNNPVGVVWVGLSAEGIGIHGTPDPATVGKAESHGCIRLTNWDADDLSKRVAKGMPVVFLEEAGERSNARQDKRQRGAVGGRSG